MVSPSVAAFLSVFYPAVDAWVLATYPVDVWTLATDPTSPNYALHPGKLEVSTVSLRGRFGVWASSSVSLS